MGSHNDIFELNLECSSSNFKKNFISIIEKFTKLADQGKHTDEVDIETLEIVVDKGFLKDAKRKSFGKSLLASELDTSSPNNANNGGKQIDDLSHRETLPWNFKEIFDNDFGEFCNSKDHDKSLNYEGVIHKKLTYEDIKMDDLLEPSDAESISSSFTEDSNDDEESVDVDVDCPLSDSLNRNTSADPKSSSSATSPSTKDDTTSKLSNDDVPVNCHEIADGDGPESCQETSGSASAASSSDEINSRNSINLSYTNNNIILQNEDVEDPNESLNHCDEHSLTDGVLDLRCHKTPSKPDVVISSNDVEQFSGSKRCAVEKSKKRILLSSIENTVHPPTSNRSSLLKEDFQGTLNHIKNNSPDELIQPIQFLREVTRCSDEAFHSKKDCIRNHKQKDLKSAHDKNSEMPLLQGRRYKHDVFDPSVNETFKVDSTCRCKMHSEICLKMIPNLDYVNCKNDVSPVDNQSKTNGNDSNETFLVNKFSDSALNGARTTVPNIDSTRLLTPKRDFSDVVPERSKGPFQTSQLLWNAFMGSRNNFSNYKCINGRCVPVDLKAPPRTFSPLAETVVESEHFIGFVLPKCPQISFEEAPFTATPLNTNFASLRSLSRTAHEKTGRDNSASDSSVFESDGNAHLDKHPGVARKEATVSNCGNKEASSKCVKNSKSNIDTKNELEVRNLEFSEARKKFLGRLSSRNCDDDFKSGVSNSVMLKTCANIKLSPNLIPSQWEAGLNEKFLQATTCIEGDKAIISNSVDLDLIPDSEQIRSSVKALNFSKTANDRIGKNRRTSYKQLENITNHIPSKRNARENNIESEGLASFKTPGDAGKQIKSNLDERSFGEKLLENKEAFDVARERFFKTRSSFVGTQNNKISSMELSENKTTNVTRNVNKTPAEFTEPESIRNREEEFIEPRIRVETRAMQSHRSSDDNVLVSGGSSKNFVYEKETRPTERFNDKEPKNGINKMSTFMINRKNRKKSTFSNLKPCTDIDEAIEPCSLLYSSSDYESENDTTADKVSIGDMVKKKEMQSMHHKYISLSTQRTKSTENNVSEFEKYEEDCLMSTSENPSVVRRTKNKSAPKNVLKRKMECESDSDDVFNISNYSDSLDRLSKKHDVPVERSRKNLDRLDRKWSYAARARMNNSKGEVNSGLVLVKKRPTSKLYCANDAFSLTDEQTYSRAGQPRKKKLMVANYIKPILK